MASSFANFSFSGSLTIDAVPAGVIRIRRVLITSTNGVSAEVVSDPEGSASPIGPSLRGQSAGESVLDFDLTAEPLLGARGHAVGISTSATNPHSVWVEYDVAV